MFQDNGGTFTIASALVWYMIGKHSFYRVLWHYFVLHVPSLGSTFLRKLSRFRGTGPHPESHVRDTATNVLTRLLYRPQIVVDGNMKLVHFRMKCPEADVSLSDGKAFMVERGPYEEHLANAPERQPVCNPPLMVSRSFNSRGDVEIPMS